MEDRKGRGREGFRVGKDGGWVRREEGNPDKSGIKRKITPERQGCKEVVRNKE